MRRRPSAASIARVACRALLLTMGMTMLAAAPAQHLSGVADPPRGDMRIVVFGDFNGPYGSVTYPAPVARALAAIVQVWRPDLWLSPGDVVAGQNGALPDAALPAMWAAFDAFVAAPMRAAGIPYAVAMGNHDASSLRDPGGGFTFERDRRAAAAYWGQPMYANDHRYVDREGFPFDHAFRSGEAFVAVIDASSATVTPAQRAWLQRVLRTPEAAAARLRIVVGHLPLAAVGRGRDRAGEVVAGADALRSVLEEGRVDLYVSGHHAAYFPGRLGRLEMLFAGGVGARALLAGGAAPRSTVTLIDVWFEPLDLRYTTFDLATFEVVPAGSLPPEVRSGDATVRRSDRALPRGLVAGP